MVFNCCFSLSICKTKAVEESARAKPITILAAMPCCKAKKLPSAKSRPVRPTCKLPMPKIELRILHSRCGRSSRPIRNISKITPNSASSWIASGSLAMLKTSGPSKIPVNRYPNTVAIPKRLSKGTSNKDAPRKIVICNSSDIYSS